MKPILVKTFNGSRYLFYREGKKDYFAILSKNANPSHFPIEFFDMRRKGIKCKFPPEDKFILLFNFAIGETEGESKFIAGKGEKIIVKRSMVGDIDLKESNELNVLDSLFSPLIEIVKYTFVSDSFILEEDYEEKDEPKFHPEVGKSMYMSMERDEGAYIGFITTGEVSEIEVIEDYIPHYT